MNMPDSNTAAINFIEIENVTPHIMVCAIYFALFCIGGPLLCIIPEGLIFGGAYYGVFLHFKFGRLTFVELMH